MPLHFRGHMPKGLNFPDTHNNKYCWYFKLVYKNTLVLEVILSYLLTKQGGRGFNLTFDLMEARCVIQRNMHHSSSL